MPSKNNFNPDGSIKNKIVHKSGKAGGMLVGNRHSNGGIKAINKSTGQPLEMEGGEVVITRDAVSDNTRKSFNGKMLTNREILSEINTSGGGVSFADGGEVPDNINYDADAEYEYRGDTMKVQDLMHRMAKGGKISDKALSHQRSQTDDLNDIVNAVQDLDVMMAKGGVVYDADFNNGIFRNIFKASKDPIKYTEFKDKFGGTVTSYSLSELVSDLKREFSNVKGKSIGTIWFYDNFGGVEKKQFSINNTKTTTQTINPKTLNEENLLKLINKRRVNSRGRLFELNLYEFVNGTTQSVPKGTEPFAVPQSVHPSLIDDSIGNTSVRIKTSSYKLGSTDYITIEDLKHLYTVVNYNYDHLDSPHDFIALLQIYDTNLGDFRTVARISLITGILMIQLNDKVGTIKPLKDFDTADFLKAVLYDIDNPNVKFNLKGLLEVTDPDWQSDLVTLTRGATKSTYPKQLISGRPMEVILAHNNDGKHFAVMSSISELIETANMEWDTQFRNEGFEMFVLIKADNGTHSRLGKIRVYIDTQGANELAIESSIKPDEAYLLKGLDIDKFISLALLSSDDSADNFGLKEFFDNSLNGSTPPPTTTKAPPLLTTLMANINGLNKGFNKLSDFESAFPLTLGQGSATSYVYVGDTNVESLQELRQVAIDDWKRMGQPIDVLVTSINIKGSNNQIREVAKFFVSQENGLVLTSIDAEIMLDFFTFGLSNFCTLLEDLSLNRTGYVFNISKFVAGSLLTSEAVITNVIRAFPRIFEEEQPQINYAYTFELKLVLKGQTELIKTGIKSYAELIKELNQFTKSEFWSSSASLFVSVNDDHEQTPKVFALGISHNGINEIHFVVNITDRAVVELSDLSPTILAFGLNAWANGSNEFLYLKSFFSVAIDDFLNIKSKTSTSKTSNNIDNSPNSRENRKKFLADPSGLFITTNTLKQSADSSIIGQLQKDLTALFKLLPFFQDSKYAKERSLALAEIKKIHEKLLYSAFEENAIISSPKEVFTPQGLLGYYYTQTTQNPTAELEPECKLITPNGKESKLPLSAYLNVRTEQFKDWFGDWEMAFATGNYVNCSKMIDEETKEPKIYYHGVRKFIPNFGQMNNMGAGVVRPYGAFEPPNFPASYFASEKSYAEFYGGIAPNMEKPSDDYKPFIYKVFLNIKNPVSIVPLGFEINYRDLIDYMLVAYGIRLKPNKSLLSKLGNDYEKMMPMWVFVRHDISFIEALKDYGCDALMQIGDIPKFLPDGTVEPDRSKHLREEEILTFYPNQVKSATVRKSFYFNFFNDIRFKQGGYVRL